MLTQRNLILSTLALAARGADLISVKAKHKPQQQWKEYPTRTIHHLEGFRPGASWPEVAKFGGRAVTVIFWHDVQARCGGPGAWTPARLV
jgi:hypothetical protein